MRKNRIKKKLKENIVGATFALALVVFVASIGSIGEPGFAWDKLPAALTVAVVSLVYIMLVGSQISMHTGQCGGKTSGSPKKTKQEAKDHGCGRAEK